MKLAANVLHLTQCIRRVSVLHRLCGKAASAVTSATLNVSFVNI